MVQKILISKNHDGLENSYWVTGSIVEKIFNTLKITIKPEIAVNVKPSGYEIHLDSDTTMQWQFYLRVTERTEGFQYSIDLLYDSAKGTRSGVIKNIMESSYFKVSKRFDNEYTHEVLLETFFIYLLDAIKNRVF